MTSTGVYVCLITLRMASWPVGALSSLVKYWMVIGGPNPDVVLLSEYVAYLDGCMIVQGWFAEPDCQMSRLQHSILCIHMITGTISLFWGEVIITIKPMHVSIEASDRS